MSPSLLTPPPSAPPPPHGCSADPSDIAAHSTAAVQTERMHDAPFPDSVDMYVTPSTILPSSSTTTLASTTSTNAFHGLVAWFSKDVHPTAKYAWTLNKGTLASLSGIESGEQPVDVIFAQPRDSLLQRLPDLGIPVLNSSYIRLSLESGKLLPIRTFQLLTGSPSTSNPKELTMQSAKETSRHGASNGYHGSSSAPQSNPPTIPPSPTSLEVQNDIVINEETTSRGSVLSTRKATINKSIQPVEKAAEMKRPFVCRGTCPELTCEHRTDLRINTNKPPHNNRLQFQQLTGFSPSLKKGFSSTSSSQNTTIQAKVEESSDDNGLRPPFLKKPLNVRIASMKMQIDALQSRSPSVRGIKIESSSTPPREIRSSSKGSDMSRKLSHGVSNKVEIEARSPYAITSNDNFANNKDNIDILDQTLKQAYRKKYCAPESIVLEDCNSMISKSSQTGFNYELVEPLQKDLAETAFAFQSTPVSLK